MKNKAGANALKALFIGNSFTARNNVPQLIAQLAESSQKTFEHRLISAGGASLRMHWNKGDAQKEIQKTSYDYVVLQEQSTLPIKNGLRMAENIRLFDPVIRESGAKTALYLIWARQHAPQSQKAITDAYCSIGEEIGAVVVPVGIAWEKLLSKKPAVTLHDADQSHPSIAGSYLAACVFFATFFDQSPEGIKSELKQVSAAEIKLLQKTAWSTVKSFNSEYYF